MMRNVVDVIVSMKQHEKQSIKQHDKHRNRCASFQLSSLIRRVSFVEFSFVGFSFVEFSFVEFSFVEFSFVEVAREFSAFVSAFVGF